MDAPSPVQIFETLTAYQNTAALKAAIEFDLFTAIGDNGATATELASRCSAAERGLRILCDYLTVLRFLEKKGDRYYLTKDSAAFLNRNSPTYAGGAAEFLLSDHLTHAFADVAAAVRKGGTTLAGAGSMAPGTSDVAQLRSRHELAHEAWRTSARGDCRTRPGARYQGAGHFRESRDLGPKLRPTQPRALVLSRSIGRQSSRSRAKTPSA
jgi:hypothetical protein